MSENAIKQLSGSLEELAVYSQEAGLPLIIMSDGLPTGGMTKLEFDLLRFHLNKAVPNVCLDYISR